MSTFADPSTLLRRTSLLAFGALLCGAVATACRSDVVYGDDGEYGGWGEYSVTLANAQTLPATIRRGAGSRTEVLSGSLRLESDGDCRVWMRIRITTLGVPSTAESSERCRWTQDEDRLRFFWADDRTTSTGRRDSDARVTLYWDEDTFVFTR